MNSPSKTFSFSCDPTLKLGGSVQLKTEKRRRIFVLKASLAVERKLDIYEEAWVKNKFMQPNQKE